jgi:hypothetical protein
VSTVGYARMGCRDRIRAEVYWWESVKIEARRGLTIGRLTLGAGSPVIGEAKDAFP